jgi:hypothetical protein
MHRQICADPLVFERDGVIQKIEPTHRGVGRLGSRSDTRTEADNLAFRAKITASSFYSDTLRNHDYKPEYAVDDNNATLWRPGDNGMGHWLSVDLGRPQRVRQTRTQFEYGTWFYQYLIEASLDGETWQTFADRRQNTRWGSPMVDNGDVEARYLRLTVTGTELPGLFGAVWNFKVYGEAQDDPLLTMADAAFAKFIAPKQNQRAENARLTASDGAGTNDAASDLNPLIHLDVAGLQLGAPIDAWTNQGSLGGAFRSRDAKPIVDMAGGCNAVRFSGAEMLTASFPAPRALSGNSSFTVAAWVNNPEIAESECILSWAGRGGPDATTAQFGYGTQREFGAVGHWGFADMGFRGAPPQAGQWHHLAVVFDGVIERVYVNGQLDNAEAKMLLMHEGRPVYVGASEPGTEYFDGYLASLRVYDRALNEEQVRALAARSPEADILVHVDSARLDYGALKSWANSGSLGGAFTGGNGPVVEDVHGRIAPRFDPRHSLELAADVAVTIEDFTLLVGIANPSKEESECPLEWVDGEDRRHALLPTPPQGGWRQLALVRADGRGTYYVDGEPTPAKATLPPKTLKGLRLGGQPAFSGALNRVQLFRRALSPGEIAQLHTLWKQEWQTPEPDPAAFARKPAALLPTAVAMTAQQGESEYGRVEYHFQETSGNAGATSSGWTPNASFLDDGLQPDTRYTYIVSLRDPKGNVTAASEPVEVATDTVQFQTLTAAFQTDYDYLAQGVDGTIWDGLLSEQDSSKPEVIAQDEGVLRLQSSGTVWDGGRPLGAFLFTSVSGDFVAEATVADYAGLATRTVPGNNDGGLMVRVPEVEEAGPGEDLVQLNFFPIWNQGNMVTNLDGGRSQVGNMLAWDAHPHLQIIRQGTLFHFRTSADGASWQDMPGSPVDRPDMAGMPLQVGLYHASYGGDSSYVTFSRFRLITRK